MEYLDKLNLSKFFNDHGYVLDFNDVSFEAFTKNSVGFSLKQKYRASKGKSLDMFTENEDDHTVLKLYSDLLSYYENFYLNRKLPEETVEQYKICKQIIEKYSIGSDLIVSPSIAKFDRPYVKEIASRANKSIDSGNTDSAITQVRTLVEEVLIKGLEDKEIDFKRSGNVMELFKAFKNTYNMNSDPTMDERIKSLLSGLNTIVSSIGEMRNANSDSHGVGKKRIKIEKHHARLFVNAGIIVSEFLIEVINNQN